MLTAGTDFFPEIISYRLEPGIPNLYTLEALCKVLRSEASNHTPCMSSSIPACTVSASCRDELPALEIL